MSSETISRAVILQDPEYYPQKAITDCGELHQLISNNCKKSVTMMNSMMVRFPSLLVRSMIAELRIWGLTA